MVFNQDVLLYRGIAYPSKSAPLIFTGTGIGSDPNMKAIVSASSSIAETKTKLQETVESALDNTEAESQRHIDSMKFLKKDTYLSLSAYSYIDSDFEDAKKYYLLSQDATANIPDDIMGNRYAGLEKIMNYLINTIGE
jgi:vacuolar-type H+-ATPase catalytic subunit A/Vma1